MPHACSTYDAPPKLMSVVSIFHVRNGVTRAVVLPPRKASSAVTTLDSAVEAEAAGSGRFAIPSLVPAVVDNEVWPLDIIARALSSRS